MHVFDWLYVTQCLTSFSSISHLLLCAWFFILFYLTQMRFSLSTPLLMHLSLETLMPIVKTGLHILVELIVFCSTLAFPPFENSDHIVVSVSIDFPSYSQQDAPFHHISYDYSCADWDGLHNYLRDVPWEDIFKLSASAAASEFWEWVRVGIDV